MKLYQPTCWKSFQCTASQCSDNCCIGWEIDIDPDSYARYQALPGDFGEQVRASIQPGETPCFRMNGERCAMLNGENLCEIYRRLGKEGLCQICHDHPLFTDTFGTRRETGLGLCCEEAARLLFAQTEPLTLYATDTAEPEYPEEVEETLVEQMTALRDHLFRLLHDRTVPINLRLCQLLIEAQEAQWIWEEERWEEMERLFHSEPGRPDAVPMDTRQAVSLLQEWVTRFETFEPINDAWTALLGQCKTLLQQPEPEIFALWQRFVEAMADRTQEYEQLMSYFLFRYFLKCVYTGDCRTPVRLAVVSTMMIAWLDATRFWQTGQFTATDRIQVAGLYSKQMEYSEENWAGLEEALLFDQAFEDTLLQDLLCSL